MTVTSMERLADRVRRLRALRKLTQEDLAAKTGLSRVYLARLETSHHKDVSLTTLTRLAKALRVPISKLVD